MKYTDLGKTGLKLSHLCFGASSLGSVFRETNEAESIKAVEVAIDGGINFIDVSPYYGHYKAETVLGKALKNIPREKYYLSTKVGRYGKDGKNTWDYSGKRATESVYESLERLNVDYIDLINVHDIEFQASMDGGLAKVVSILAGHGVNIEYTYAFMTRSHGKACVVFRVEDNEAAKGALTDAGFKLVQESDIQKL